MLSEREIRLRSKRERKEGEIPWNQWERLSLKAEAYDTYHQSCGHSFWQIPYSIEFLVSSKITLENLNCKAAVCEAEDQYFRETDTNFLSKITPPNIRALNKNAALVLNEEGIIQGPFTFLEWLTYSWGLWDKFHLHIQYEEKISFTNIADLWSEVFFRDPEQFCAGNYNLYSPIHLLMIRKLNDLDSQHRSYADMHSGVDLWSNLEPLDIDQAKSFRQNGKMFNIPLHHVSNHKIRGCRLENTNLLAERQKRKNYFHKLTTKHSKGSHLLAHALTDESDHMEVWYPLCKQLPLRLVSKKNSQEILPAEFSNNEEHTTIHVEKIIKCLTGFLTTGAVRLMPSDYKPLMTASLVLANAENPLKKTRPCFDGGPLKVTEAFKMPCKLEGLPQIFSNLTPGCRTTKMDDTQGFHLVAVHPESKDLCNFRFAGRTWRYNAMPFGERSAPAAFQQANQIPLNYCRLMGITVSCYLDDRLISEPPNLHLNGEEIDPKLGRSTYLVVLLIIASGGFINMKKSQFVPTFEDEFLGMIINSKDCTVRVPERKWEKLQADLKKYQNSDTMTLGELEVLRGEMCSMLIASKYLKIFIRAQTQIITEITNKFSHLPHRKFKNTEFKITDRLRREWEEWQHSTILQVSRCWMTPKEQKIPVFFLHTDASLSAWGAVLYHGNVLIEEIALPFSEQLSDWTIVQKEMLAIYYALVHFARYLVDTYIIEYCDNQQACWSFVNDGSGQERVNELLVKIYRVLFLLKSEIKVVWVPTHLQIADEPSRCIDLNEEFIPKPHFEIIRRLTPFHLTVDAMASIANFKCDKFIVRKHLKIPHQGIISFDFLHTPAKMLQNENLYIFPPKVALEKVIRHLELEFKHTNFVLVFHQFLELPFGLEKLLRWPSTSIITLSDKQAFSFIPSERDQQLFLPFLKEPYSFKGSPNIRPKSLRMLINFPAQIDTAMEIEE